MTLHVGAGTFLPVKADDTADHRMHAEYGVVSAETADALNAARARRRAHRGGRLDLAAAARKRRRTRSARSSPFAGETAIFITPGYRFRAVDVMLTNFHLPRSTLFMLVAAFSGLDTHAGAPTRTRSRPAIASIPTATPAFFFAANFESHSRKIRAPEITLRSSAAANVPRTQGA